MSRRNDDHEHALDRDQEREHDHERSRVPEIEAIYLIHHSHTDIGYTHDQPVVWDLHTRFLDEAIELAERSEDKRGDAAFRWTVECTSVLEEWLKRAGDAQIERFLALEKAGRIEATAMYCNVTPLYDVDELVESFQIVKRLRHDFGLTIRHAMNCDVNGEIWPLVDILLDLGIEGFTMTVNEHTGGAPFVRPNAFLWEGPSGRRLPVWNTWPYLLGLHYGIGDGGTRFREEWWPALQAHLHQIGYPFPVLMIQCYHPFGDNASAWGEWERFVKRWNEEGHRPRMRLAVPADWWAVVRGHKDRLPVHRGDWTDYWNFGSASSARETAINRASRQRLVTADALAGAVRVAAAGTGPGAGPGSRNKPTAGSSRLDISMARYRAEAWRQLFLYDEHTWGADGSITTPNADEVASQWHHKAGYAYTARSLSLLLQRDAIAELAAGVEGEAGDLLLFNPLPFERDVAGLVERSVLSPRGRADDVTSGRHFQDRSNRDSPASPVTGPNAEIRPGEAYLKPVRLPAFGWKRVNRDAVIDLSAGVATSESAVVENERHRLEFDRERGGVVSWFDKRLGRELVDRASGFPLHGYVHERVADDRHPDPRTLIFEVRRFDPMAMRPPRGWKPDWRAVRQGPSRLAAHKVYHTGVGAWVVQQFEAPGVLNLLTQVAFLPSFAPWVEFESWWEMTQETHPEATYLYFPFDVPEAKARVDLGGQSLLVDEEQLPGVCRDYFTVQRWADLSNDSFGVTIAAPDNPMVQFGGFHFGRNQERFELERAHFLGWVTNNYWQTNFRAHQPGRVRARYRILPHAGRFDESAAHRFGAEAAHALPLAQQMGEPKRAAGALLPGEATLVHLPEGPVQTLHVKPAGERSLLVRLLNASDEPARAEIRSGLARIGGAALCGLLGEPIGRPSAGGSILGGELRDGAPRGGVPSGESGQSAEPTLEFADGRVIVAIPPRRIATVLVDCSLG